MPLRCKPSVPNYAFINRRVHRFTNVRRILPNQMTAKQINNMSNQSPRKRPLDQEEKLYIQTVLNELFDHFYQWKSAHTNDPHGLMEFAYYEGCGDTECCGDILFKAAPFALGTYLKTNYGCEWVMVKENSSWHFAIDHEVLDNPIELLSLESGQYYRQDPEDVHEYLARGEKTIYSAQAIINLINLGKRQSQ